ncbi:hypothetical protein [Sandaracinus amylolyticus]|uniref:hypothetical protein n=1 Tax=Sandaracinus amylolyticus TaxID=927083 RepID=UPI001F1645A4|nr:hypothetical protein [Sandaracinus amylolyticus]UJR80126.1 Hypothetical protein I5071_21700 [Sandaracinus amylolyticus]
MRRTKQWMWMMSTGLALAACSESPGATPDASSATTSDAGATITPPLPLPYYEVPVTDPALAPHAFFFVPDVHVVVAAGEVTLTYDFPPDLSGVVDQTVTLRGPVGPVAGREIEGTTLTDAVGTGTCTVDAAGVARCTEIFTALPLDYAAALAAVEAGATSAEEALARRAVVDAFVSDPIGIVVFDLATALEPSGGDDDDEEHDD